MKNTFLLITGFLLFLFSCTKEVEIDIPQEKPKIVTYSTIVPFTLPIPKPLGIRLQSSLHIFDNSQSKMDDAIVMYFENGILKDTLKYIDSLDMYSISNDISDYPITGNTYSIKIHKEGFETITSTTKIPSRVAIKDTAIIPISYIDELGSVFSEISITFTDPIDEINFYEICVSDIAFNYDSSNYFYELSTYDNTITSESYYPSLIRFDIDKPKYLLFNDKSINGKEYSLRVYYNPPQREDDKRYIANHYISVHLRNVTHDYYKFKTSMIQHLYNKEEDILYGMGEPINVISNIDNGYGLFAGFNNDIISFFYPRTNNKRIVKVLVFNIILLFFSLSLFSQNKTTLSGFVYDKNTGEVLIGATLLEKETKTGTVSNEYGFYSLTVHSTEDSLEVEISYLGYKSINMKIPTNQNIHKDFKLIASAIALDNVTIVASKEDNIVKRNETGVVRLPIKDIKTLPNLFGEVDIVKAYQLTPGVQSGGEAKSNLYVRGGSPDQNLILLDDVPLYYVAHFGGFFSVFNADAINDVKLIKGGFPARYGSRLSSVLDIRMKEGNMQKLSVQGTIGLLSSKVSVEAPIIKEKMSFILSARKNLLPIFKIMGTGISYHFYDINAKLNYRISQKDKLFLSYYMGDDNISMSEKTEISNNNTTVKWGNTLFAFRWNHVFNSKLFSNLTLSNTYYRFKNIFEYDVKTDSQSKSLSNSLLTGINDIILKLDFTYLANANLNFRFGANNIYHTFIPNDEHFSQEGTGVVSKKENYSSSINAIENGLYLENDLKFNLISTNMGFRYSSYHIGSTNYYSFEPRVLLNCMLSEDFSIKYSYSKMNQYVHLLAYSGVGIPSDYWMPTNENVKPENSLQNTIGISKTFQNNKYEFSLEAYHKTLNNLITFLPGESLVGNLDSWENVVEKNGAGLNYGLEFFLQKKYGKTTGWVGFTTSRAVRTFDKINNGDF